jgi:hypothetical protein
MQQFTKRHEKDIFGVLNGFDRMRFRGTIRWFGSVRGMMSFLWDQQLRLTQFKKWAKDLTGQIDDASEQIAKKARSRKIIYLNSSSQSKEKVALEIANEKKMTEGLVCVLKCVEPCVTFKVGPNPKDKKLELRRLPGKCSHYYFYMLHPRYGLLHLRLQAWLPFTIHVCLNGREWLAQELRQRKIGFEQRDNCFVWIKNLAAAQALAEQQLRTNWNGLLEELRRQFHPVHEKMFGKALDIYWSADETEWATDVMFRSRSALERIYPALVQHGMNGFGCGDVLKFLGRSPDIRRYRAGDIVVGLKTRPEGTCLRHRLNRNSIKMYDKQETVLRVETTINDPRDMKVLRPREGHPREPKTWQRLRKGVSDLDRRAEVSQESNERYVDALATVHHEHPLGEIVKELCQPTEMKGRRVRALQPLSPDDSRLLLAVNRGEFVINGFRNRDLRALLFGAAETAAAELKRQGARTTRQIRLLRAHRLIRKIPKTHRYTLTEKGRLAINALLAAQAASPQQLAQLAA